MPSDAQATGSYTGRCYCGAFCLSAKAAPVTVAYCHCTDCRRWTGSPLPAFAAFSDADIVPPDSAPLEVAPGVKRWACHVCGSPMMARFDYLPGQTYVPLGVLDDAAQLPPEIHCHANQQLPWLHVNDTLPRAADSARDALNSAGQ